MIVLDASTAILLAKAELLDRFLRDAGQLVVMPSEVRDECRGRDSLDAKLIGRAIEEKRISVKSVDRRGVVQQLIADFGLGIGEAAAIALASSNGGLVATDDKRAINACKVLRIPFTTALSVLTRMYEKGLVDRSEALGRLEALARYGRYKKAMVATARAELEK